MEMKPIKQSAIAYAEVLAALEGTSVCNPITIKDVHLQCPSATGEQQVWDALRKYRLQGQVKRIREGREYKYWRERHDPTSPMWTTFGAEMERASVKNIQEQKPQGIDKPEVLITDKAVIITSSRIKVTIEY
jgi:hypothetical protein